MDVLISTHSGLRWLVLLFLVVAIVNAARKKRSGVEFSKRDKGLGLIALAVMHSQVLLGIVMYFMSSKVAFGDDTFSNSILRFFTVEHLSLMLLAAVIITIGYVRSKKASSAEAKFDNIFLYYLFGLIIILLAIPWPFRDLGSGWF